MTETQDAVVIPAHRSGHGLDAVACRALWCEVLRLAVDDLRGLGRGLHGGARQHVPLESHAARAWIGSRDFHHVCALAGFDGGAVEARLRAMVRGMERAA